MKKPALHKAPPVRPDGVNLFALPQGGFLIRDPMHSESYSFGRGDVMRVPDAVAFSTLDEALDWLRDNMARPAVEPAAKAGAEK